MIAWQEIGLSAGSRMAETEKVVLA